MVRILVWLEYMFDSSRSLVSFCDVIKILINMVNFEDEEEVDVVIFVFKNFFIVFIVGVVIVDCIGLEVLFIMYKFENFICFLLVKGGKELCIFEKNE